MSMAGLRRRELTEGNKEGSSRPLMLKDFLNDTNSMHVSKKRRRHRADSNKSHTTIRYLLEMESDGKKRAFQGSGIISSKLAMSTHSAFRKASEVLVKILPCSTCSPSQYVRGTTILQSHGATKLGLLQRMASVRGSHSLKRTFSRGLSTVMRSLPRPCHHNKSEDEIQVRVRDIMGWTSFGDEELMYSEYCNKKTLSQKEPHLQTLDRTLDSFSSSRTSSCTWSDFGQEIDSASNLNSYSDSSVCSGGADGLKDEMHLLNYHGKKEDGVATEGTLKLEYFDRPKSNISIESLGFNHGGAIAMSGEGLDSLDTADTHRYDKQQGSSSWDYETCADSEKVILPWAASECLKKKEMISVLRLNFNHARVLELEKQRIIDADVQYFKRGRHGCNICNVESYPEEQFSSLSILDFLFEEVEVTATSAESLPNIRRNKRQLLQNCLKETVAKLDAIDINNFFASSIFEFPVEDSEDFTECCDGHSGDCFDNVVEREDVEERIMEVPNECLNATEKTRWESFRSLVIDVFREESSFGNQLNEDQLVKAVARRIKEWLVKGHGMDENMEFPMKEMEINQYWKGFGVDDEMAVEMEVAVFRFLVDELLFDLMDSIEFGC